MYDRRKFDDSRLALERILGRHLSRREFMQLLATGAAGSILAACAPAATPAPPPEATATPTPAGAPKGVVFVHGGELDSMHPARNASNVAMNFFRQIMDQLVNRDEITMEHIPWLAESWKLLDDTTWEFKLREGVKFHNGDELTAEDVEFTFKLLFDPDYGTRTITFIQGIKEVKAVDRYTVQFTTDGPDPILNKRLTTDAPHILPKKYYEEVGDEGFNAHPIGTGAFKFVEWVIDDHITVEAFDDYWGGRPKIDRVIYKPVKESSTRVAMLKAGEADVITIVKPDQVDSIREDPNLEVMGVPGGCDVQIQLIQHTDPVLRQVNLRRALYYAIDRESIIKNILLGFGELLNCGIGKKAFGHNPDIEPYPYDPDKARELLKTVDLPPDWKFKVVHTEGMVLEDIVFMPALEEYWREVGIPVERRLVDRTERSRQATEGEASFLTYWCGAATFTSELHQEPNLHCPSRYPALLCDPPDAKLQSWVEEMLATMDNDKREQMCRDIWAYAMDQALHLYLWTLYYVDGYNKRLTNVNIRSDGFVTMQRIGVQG